MDTDNLLAIREIIVVEGIHDKQVVERAVRAEVWVIGGDRVARRFLRELARAGAHRGVIVLTDPDGPGERIRRRIESSVPDCKHAFIAKGDALSPSGVGVEHASPDAVLAAILQARPTRGDATTGLFAVADLISAGLVGQPDSATRRQAVGEALSIGTANAKAFVRKLNVLGITREEWEQALKQAARKEAVE